MRFFVTRFGYTLVVISLLLASALMLFAQRTSLSTSFPSTDSFWPSGGSKSSSATGNRNSSYDLLTPPTVGCESLVNDLQQRLIQAYSKRLEGIRYANIWGYLETENNGDAAIWSAQQILLSMLGIETMEACRFVDKDCDIEKFRARLEEHRPHSGIIMAGGGNFNDYYWEDQPSRMKMIETFTNVSVRAFPQSIYMTKPDRIEATKQAFTQHKDLQLAARDRPSWEWLDQTFGGVKGIETDLVPDIAFMWGNRSDFRVNTKKRHDVLILARKDMEIAEGDSADIPFGTGHLDLGGTIGNVTYLKVDWKFTDTPNINGPNEEHPNDSPREEGKSQRAWAKSIAGFELLGSARFVMTDRLHGHILSTIIGVPHVLMDSKLGKNLNFHNTWTTDCDCTRVTTSIDEALEVARLYFEKEKKDANPTNFLGQPKPSKEPAKISFVETGGTHDEVSSALIHAFGAHNNAELYLYFKTQRYGSADIVKNFTLNAPIKYVKSSYDFKKAVDKEAAPHILVSTTCELDLADGHIYKSAQELLDYEKTHLICVIHHADRWVDGKHVEEVKKWVEKERVDFVGLSQHTIDFFLKESVPKWNTQAKIVTRVLPPVFPIALPEFDAATVSGLSLAMQGDYESARRNYKGIFGNLGDIIQKVEGSSGSAADKKESVTLHLIGHGNQPKVPEEVKSHVVFDHDLSYPDFYTILSRAFSVLPAFASDTYYDRKASSSVPAALIAGAPLVASEKLLAAYSYLPREASWVAKNGEEELDVVSRVIDDRKGYVKRRQLMQKACNDIGANNQKHAKQWVDEALKKAASRS